jgi:uncharacterized protein YxjI
MEFKTSMEEARLLHVQQVFEPLELFIDWETRNKFRILDQNNKQIGFAAEQNKGFFGALARQFLGHWRSFDVAIFDEERKKLFHLRFPFCWFFRECIIEDNSGKEIGRIEQRFAIFRKKFDLFSGSQSRFATVNSGLFKFWTFDVEDHNRKIGSVKKRMSGLLTEIFTDRDNFIVEYNSNEVGHDQKVIILSLSFMVDLIYFEKKGSGSFFSD